MKHTCRRFTLGLLGSTALALATMPLPLATASAQIACSPSTSTTCIQAGQQYQLLAPFASLPSSAAGLAALQADMAAVETIYFNATVGQRNQAATNYNLNSFNPQLNLWSQIAPSSQILSTLQTFPQLQNSAALAAALSAQIPGQGGVFGNLTTFLQGGEGFGGAPVAGIMSADQVGLLKDAFFSYGQAFQGQTTQYALPLTTQNPPPPGTQNDPRPYQISQAIANSPWTSSQASATSRANQAGEWGAPGSGGGLQGSGGFPSGHSTEGFLTSLLYAVMLPQAYQSMMVSGQQFGLSRNILGVHHTLDVIGARITSYYVMAQLLAGQSPYVLPAYPSFANQVATYATQLNTLLGSTLSAVPYASCATNVAACIANGTFPNAAQFTAANQAYASLATYGLPAVGPTDLAPVVPANANLLIASRFPYLSPSQLNDVLASTELPSSGPLDNGSGWARLNLFAAAGGYGAFTNDVTVTMNASAGGFNAIDVWSNNISGSGGLTLQGSGTLVLGGDNTYTGGTVVGCAQAQGNCTPTLALSGSMIGNLAINPGGTFVTGGGYSVSPTSTLANAGTFQSINASPPLLNQGTLSNSGTLLSNLTNAGTATNTSTGTITGAVGNSGSFTNNGVVNGTVINTGVLGGSGTVAGNVTNSGVMAPGNSIGTMTVTGSYAQPAGGTFATEVAGAGQSDLLGVGGTATLGGQVFVTALPGMSFAPSTTYTILNAAGGLSGTFASVNELYPFLLSSLSYDANNVYLTLDIGGFTGAAATPTQAAVGNVLDANVNNATGDFATVLGAMAVNTLGNTQAQATLQAISGNNYAGFSSSMVQGAQLFMNNFANQTGGGGSPVSNRVALAEACDVACDSTTPPKWGAWGGALGGLGTIGANQSVGSVTYNAGGFAAGLDRAITDNFRMGLTAGYTTGTQWVSGFDGLGRSNTFQVGLYGGLARDKVYADALIGYAYTWNQMWRNITVPGLQPRTALGQTGANQWYGQIETGYRFDLGTTANAFITPFARLQAYTGTQAGFTETGAQSLNLSVAQQTTNSLRSVIGAQLGGSMDLGWREKLAMQLRLGWSHEYADTARPVSATLAGAPAMPFTTFGVAPQRDGVVLGLSANTVIAEATSVYLRYEGDISGQDSAHALTAGVRMTW